MLMDPGKMRDFKDNLARREGRPDHGKALDLFTSLWEEGRSLVVLPPADPFDGIETDLRIARILNSCSGNSLPD